MEELYPQATPEAADSSNWISLAQAVSKKSVSYLYDTFNRAAKDAAAKDDTVNSEVYGLISQVVSMSYKPDNSDTPYVAMIQTPTWRTAVLSDFTDQNLIFFKHLIGKSNLPMLDARFADVLWLRLKNRIDAETAIESYLLHAKNNLQMNNDAWYYGKLSLERATQLWRQLGQPAKYTDELIDFSEKSIQPDAPEPDDLYRVFLMELMSEYDLFKDPGKWCNVANDLAIKANQTNHFDKARKYWECAIKFAAHADDSEKQKTLVDVLTNSYVEEARSLRTTGASAMLVAEHYSEAIEACRRAGGRRKLIDELHQEMNEIHAKVVSELKKFETPFDVTEFVNAGRDAVENVSLEEAWVAIAKMAAPPSTLNLRASVEKFAKEFSLVHSINYVSFNEHGRVVARASPVLADDEKTREAGIMAQMIMQCCQGQQQCGSTTIEAARRTLVCRVISESRVFDDLVKMNPFVPDGREKIFVRGLKAGLAGDRLSCAHLLIPQIEHAVRVVMERSGLLVTRLNTEQIQKELDLNALLYKPETEQIFGKDLVFTLRALLVEELGGNYRNLLAHGLLSANRFNSGWVNYLWALTIRLCWLGKLITQRQVATEKS